MKPFILLLSLAIVAVAPAACRLGGGSMSESQMQPGRGDDRPPSEIDPALHVTSPPMVGMDGGADPAAGGHAQMAMGAEAATAHPGMDGGMPMEASVDTTMSSMAMHANPGSPHPATTSSAMPAGSAAPMQMDAGMPIDGGRGMRSRRHGPPMPAPTGSPMPMPSQRPMPMPPMGHEGPM